MKKKKKVTSTLERCLWAFVVLLVFVLTQQRTYQMERRKFLHLLDDKYEDGFEDGKNWGLDKCEGEMGSRIWDGSKSYLHG